MTNCLQSYNELHVCGNLMCNTHSTGKGSFKCYVTLEGVGGYMPKRYEALRGVGGGLRQRYVTSFFLANTLFYRRHVLASDADFKISWLSSISNIMFLCIMLTTKTCSHINNYP